MYVSFSGRCSTDFLNASVLSQKDNTSSSSLAKSGRPCVNCFFNINSFIYTKKDTTSIVLYELQYWKVPTLLFFIPAVSGLPGRVYTPIFIGFLPSACLVITRRLSHVICL